MIWVRRILTFPLGLLLFLLLLVALVGLQASETFLDPGFYTKELKKANIYEFVLVDLTTSALNEWRESDDESLIGGFEEHPLVTMGLSTEDIVSSLNKAFPPSWVQSIVEEVVDELGKYVTDENDDFQVTVRAGAQVEILVEEVKSLLRRADAYSLLIRELVTPAVEDPLAEEELPLGLKVTSERVIQSVRVVVPPDWVQTQVEAALDELTPYVVGDGDTFEIRVNLVDRVQIALEEVKLLLRETDAYDLLYEEVVEPELRKSLGGAVGLPFDTAVSTEEVISALRQVAPVEWVQEQAERIIDASGPYLTGKADHLAVTVSLADNKREAKIVILEIVLRKLQVALKELPTCTTAQLSQASSRGPLELPECIPPGVIPELLLNRFANQVAAGVDLLVLGAIPDDIRFTDTELRDALAQAGAEKNIEFLDDVREIIRDGWTYTDQDLRQDLIGELGVESVERLDDARDFLADGWTYTTLEFREDLKDAGDAGTVDDFDDGRDILGLARSLRLLIYLPVLLVLVVIGFLGGRRWSSRFAWAATFLAVTAGIIFIASGPVYGAFGESQIDDAREDAIEEIDIDNDFPLTTDLAINKGFDIGESMIDDFASGVATKSAILLAVGLIALGVSLRWSHIRRLVRRVRP